MRRQIALALSLCLLLTVAVPVAAHTSVSISPASQTKNSNTTASWTGSWNGSGTSHVTFCYGDGGSCADLYTSANSRGFSHVFCTFTYRHYTQTLTVFQGGHGIYTNSDTAVNGTSQC